MFDLENLGHGREVQHLRWCQSLVDINLHKRHTTRFYANFHRFGDIKVWNVDVEIVDQRHGVGLQNAQLSHSMENINLYTSDSMHFYTISHSSRDLNVLNVWPGKFRSSSLSTIFIVMLFGQ